MVSTHAIYAANQVRFKPVVLCCMSHHPLSPIFPICLLLNKGVYAVKKHFYPSVDVQVTEEAVLDP